MVMGLGGWGGDGARCLVVSSIGGWWLVVMMGLGDCWW